MEREVLYDLLIQIFNLDIDFSIIFDKVEIKERKEILNFIKYIKENHPKEEVMRYKLTEKSKKIILTYLDYILKKTKNN